MRNTRPSGKNSRAQGRRHPQGKSIRVLGKCIRVLGYIKFLKVITNNIEEKSVSLG